MLRLVLCSLGLLVATVLGAPNPFSPAEVTETFKSGHINDGHWYCPWYLSGFECSDGKFTCTCPGDGAEVHFKIGCCYKFPECGVICHKGTNCGKYEHCASCRSGVGEWSENVCSSCIPGFALGTGNCRTDINECQSGNGGCEQECVNTYGSYYCQCSDGFQLDDDKHGCTRQSCGHPGDISGGAVTPTAVWLYDSYARYQCNSPTLSLVGNNVRRCAGEGSNVWWDGEVPQCRDSCAVVEAADRQPCGSVSVSRDKCLQLGCCYQDGPNNDGPSCYHNPVLTFVKFAGERPTESLGNGFQTQERSNVDGCVFQCVTEESGQCQSFGIRQSGSDEEHAVDFQKCHLQQHSRSYYADKKQLRNDANYDLYEPLTIEPSLATYSAQSGPIPLLEKVYVGCFKDDKDNRDLAYHMFTSGADMTVDKCIAGCRQQGFSYAGLQDGMECYCSNSLSRIHGPSDACGVRCSGDRDQVCGAELANSVYHVPYDSRYRGCYLDTDEHDLPVSMWEKKAERSAEACIEECSLAGYKYAGVQNGGDCYCGNSYGRHGGANETACHVRCSSWGHQNCGGSSENAIYITEIPFDLSSGTIKMEATKAYDSSGKIAGISTRLFTFAPHLRSVITKKLVIYSSYEIQTPSDDWACQQNCYEPCGAISQVDQFTNVGETLTLRFFFVRLSDILQYTGSSAKKVYVYAQTVVVDESISVNFALLIYARQLIIDRTYAMTIDVHGSAPDLDIDVEAAKREGPEPELLHRKMSFTCARILLETREPKNVNTAWGIIQDIGNDLGAEEETAAFSASVRTHESFMYGMERADIHYVPYYTKSHISSLLANYYERLGLYKTNLDRLEDRSIAQEEFLKVAEDTQKIYTDTSIAQAQSDYDASKTALDTANTTYYRMKEHFDYSRRMLEEARVDFEKGLKEALAFRIVKAVFSFVGSVVKVAFGIVDIDGDALKDSVDIIVEDSQELVDTMQLLSYGVQQMESLDKMTDDIFHQLEYVSNVHDSVQFVDDIEMTVAMHTQLIHWSNFRNYGEIMLGEDTIRMINGAARYKTCLMDLINWGQALTKSVVEKAELVRYSMDCKFTLNAKLRQQQRIQAVFDQSREGLVEQEAIMRAIYEQTYDVRADLNEALLMFCQSYFFENHYDCKDSYKPSFGGDLNDLLLKINNARRDELLIPGAAPSTASRYVHIRDADTDPECNDALYCPVNYFRRNRVFQYQLPLNHSDLVDLDKYMVAEIILNFEGAKPMGVNRFLKLRIESTGDFQSKYRGNVYTFLTKPLALAFEYDVIDGHISLRADVYKPYRNIVNHITPYSMWVMRVAEERSADIDVSGVTSLTMRLDGSATDISVYKNTPEVEMDVVASPEMEAAAQVVEEITNTIQ